MLRWSTILIWMIALITGVLQFSGGAGVNSDIVWIFFIVFSILSIVFLVLFIIDLIMGRQTI